VTRHDKTLGRLLSGTTDRSFRFDELCAILRRLGFDERQRGGSHHIFFRKDLTEILNLQPRTGGQAKPYQVRQVRDVIVKYGLAEAIDQERDDGA
jgi:HicA-like toxin of HicAB toxin-antitoxin system